MTSDLTSPDEAEGRPLFHFTPPSNWLNDPNGLVYYDGEYHLFYQYHPHDLVWGPMHWGHAVSRDLLGWEHLPIALAPDAHGTIFSGSAVVDWRDTAGFGAEALVALYTQWTEAAQVQSLAYSTDKGRNWTKYAGNPILLPPPGQVDFRDPKVFWYGDARTGHWVMLLAAGQEVRFYTSPDLKHWTKTSAFGAGYGAHDGVWETPDLFALPVDGGPQTRWVLVVAVQQGAPAGGSGVQYFVGDFDGGVFRCDDAPATVRWADYGGDFYAAQSWSDAPVGRRVWLAWMNNWSYGHHIPATTWRGAMSLPRNVALVSGSRGVELVQQPVAELARLRRERWAWTEQTIAEGQNLLEQVRGDCLELRVTFRLDGGTSAPRFGLRVRTGAGVATVIGYEPARALLTFERGASGVAMPGFAQPQSVAVPTRDGRLALHIVLDRASVEVFADGGLVTLTNQIFPAADHTGLELFAAGGRVAVESLEVFRLSRLKAEG